MELFAGGTRWMKCKDCQKIGCGGGWGVTFCDVYLCIGLLTL